MRRWAVLGVLAVAAALRLIHLRQSPFWYHDECIYVGQAWNLIHGRFQWDAVWHTFLPRLPFYHLLAGPVMLLLGKDLLCVRLVSALSGLVSIWLVYRIGRRLGNGRAGILGALMFAVCPYAVLLNRMGFSFNLDCALGAANLYFLVCHCQRPDQSRYLWLAAVAAGLGLATDINMAGRVILLAAAALATVPAPRAMAAVCLSLAPLGLYAAVMIVFHRLIFFEDVAVLWSRTPAPESWLEYPKILYYWFAMIGGYGVAGLVGLWLLPKGAGRRVVGFCLALDLAILVKLSAGDTSLAYRMGIFAATPIFVGAGFFLDWVWVRSGKWARGGLAEKSALQSVAPAIAPALLAAALAVPAVRGVLGDFYYQPQRYRDSSLEPGADVEKAAEWLSENAEADDVVLATHMEWLLDCRVSSFMLSVAVGSRGALDDAVYFSGLARRTVYRCGLRDARYLLDHPATQEVVRIYGLKAGYDEALRRWPVVFSSGDISIRMNPDHPGNWK